MYVNDVRERAPQPPSPSTRAPRPSALAAAIASAGHGSERPSSANFRAMLDGLPAVHPAPTLPTAASYVLLPALRGAAPAFTGQAVVDGDFKTISLSDYKGKYVVLFFCEFCSSLCWSSPTVDFVTLLCLPLPLAVQGETASLGRQTGSWAGSRQQGLGPAWRQLAPWLPLLRSVRSPTASQSHAARPPSHFCPRQTPLTGPLCAPRRSSPSASACRSSATSAWRWVLPPACRSCEAAPWGRLVFSSPPSCLHSISPLAGCTGGVLYGRQLPNSGCPR